MAKTKTHKIRAKKASSIYQFIEIANSISKEWELNEQHDSNAIWYRGVNSAKYDLLPGAYRLQNYHENEHIQDFKNMAIPFLKRIPANEWEWYYLTQHYGLPTRLLDWTESQLIAAYFALDRWDGRTTPCVWMTNAGEINRRSYGDYELIFPNDKFTEKWLPSYFGRSKKTQRFKFKTKNYSNKYPIAIIPTWANPRIVGQQGMFTIHGKSTAPMQELFLSHRRFRHLLIRIDLDGKGLERRLELLAELRVLGVTKTILFPELSSVAEDIKNRYFPTV